MGKLLNVYTKLYYGENAISSCYTWELGESLLNGFSCYIVITNEVESLDYISLIDDDKDVIKVKSEDKKLKNYIDSHNLFNIKFSSEIIKNKEYVKVCYKLTSTMVVGIKLSKDCYMGSNLTKNFEENHYINDYTDKEFHIDKIGKMLEFAENSLRLNVEEIELKKYQEILGKIKIDKRIEDHKFYYQNVVDEQILLQQQQANE